MVSHIFVLFTIFMLWYMPRFLTISDDSYSLRINGLYYMPDTFIQYSHFEYLEYFWYDMTRYLEACNLHTVLEITGEVKPWRSTQHNALYQKECVWMDFCTFFSPIHQKLIDIIKLWCAYVEHAPVLNIAVFIAWHMSCMKRV